MWLWFKRAVVAGGLPLGLAASVLAASETNSPLSSSSAVTDSSTKAEFRQPSTLAELLALPDDQLENVDLALINLLCAEGLPGSEKLNIQDHLDTLRQWSAHVEREIKRNHHRFVEHPEDYHNSEGEFRMVMLITVVQQDLQVRYSPERAEPQKKGIWESNDDFCADSRDLYIHGLLAGRHTGTCSSLPVFYVAIARRLGFPVFLARAKVHFFVHYEEGGGHINIDGSGIGCSIHPDDYYRKWPLPITEEEIQTYGYLRSINNKEALGDFLANRAGCLKSAKRFDEAAACWKLVARYLPKNTALENIVDKSAKLAKSHHDMDAWDSLWAELEKQPTPRGSQAQFFYDWKIEIQTMMAHSTDLNAIGQAVTNFTKNFRQYRNDISDNLQLESQEPKLRGPSPFFNGSDAIAKSTSVDTMDILQPDHISIAQERIPAEYLWNGIPQALQKRLGKLNSADQIIEEMNVYAAEEINLRNLDTQAHMRDQGLLVPPGFQPKANFKVTELGIRQDDLPYDLQHMEITLELQKRLAAKTQYVTDGYNKKTAIVNELRNFQIDQDQRRFVVHDIEARRSILNHTEDYPPSQIVIINAQGNSEPVVTPLKIQDSNQQLPMQETRTH